MKYSKSIEHGYTQGYNTMKNLCGTFGNDELRFKYENTKGKTDFTKGIKEALRQEMIRRKMPIEIKH